MKLTKFLAVLLLGLVAFVMVGCDKEDLELTAIVLTGTEDASVEYGETFNVLTGVNAVGNDGKDYTSLITYTSLATITDDLLDTNATGNFFIRYSVEVGEVKEVKNRYVEVKNPEKVGLVLNGDFSMGTVGWGTFSADGSEIELSVDDGALKIEIIAGSNPWTPRIQQMDIPFEIDTVYEVSFKAKSSVAGKYIHLQVGEVLSASPYFVDFKPEIQVEFVTLTTEWVTYSYKFTHVLENNRGGVLFEFGNFLGQKLDATVWLDDIVVQESVLDPDTAPPVFTGVQEETTILLDSEYDPLDGVKAIDIVDGDVTEDINVKIYKIVGETETLVTTVDTSEEGKYRIEYSVEDAAGNKEEVETIVTIAAMQFIETDIIENGDFAGNEMDPWFVWKQDWDDAPTVTTAIANGEFSITTDKGGVDVWAIQFNQAGLTLEQGVTYKLVFDAKTTVARDINVKMLIPDPVNEIYFKAESVMLSTDMETYEFLFTVTKTTSSEISVSFELGSTPNFAASTVTFDNVVLYQADLDEVLYNKDFSITGWRAFVATWDGNAADLGIVDGALELNLSSIGDLSEGWKLQVIQDAFALGTGEDNVGSIRIEPATTYRLTFDAKSSVAGNMTVAIGVGVPGWHAYNVEAVAITTAMATYTVTFTTAAEGYEALAQLKFEVASLFHGETGPQKLTIDNVKLEKMVEEAYVDTNQIANGTMDQVVGWNVLQGESGSVATMGLVNGALEIDVVNVGADPWHVHVYNGENNTITKGTYMFVVEMESSVARDVRFNLIVPSQGHRSILTDTKWDISLPEGESNVYILTFTITEDLIGIVKVELDFGNLGDGFVSVPTVITISTINIFKVYN